MKRICVPVFIVAIAACLCAPASAAAKEFDFKDPKGVNSVSFLLDSEIEPIRGVATAISGSISFDPGAPGSTSGKIVIAADSVKTSNDRMTDVLHGADWLNVEEYPEISFTFKKVERAKGEQDNRTLIQVAGEFECHGVKKEMTIPISLTYLEGRAGERMRGAKGDLLVARSEFKINRKDFDIKKDYGPTVVAEEIVIHVQIVGMAPAE